MNLELSIANLEKAVELLKTASISDEKTPLENSLSLKKEVDLIEIGKSEFNIVVFGDLNDFKSLNDNHSHEAGDAAINETGTKIHQLFVTTSKAKAFRPHGDEFIILLKENEADFFKSHTKDFKAIKFSYGGKTLTAKMSFGLTTIDKKISFSESLKRAETACSSAKETGDGVCISWNKTVEQNARQDFRRKCQNCNSSNKCSIPKRHKANGLKFCSYCGKSFE